MTAVCVYVCFFLYFSFFSIYLANFNEIHVHFTPEILIKNKNTQPNCGSQKIKVIYFINFFLFHFLFISFIISFTSSSIYNFNLCIKTYFMFYVCINVVKILCFIQFACSLFVLDINRLLTKQFLK